MWKFSRLNRWQWAAAICCCCLCVVLIYRGWHGGAQSGTTPDELAAELGGPEADLGAPLLGDAESDIAQIEFLDDEPGSPDPAFLPFEPSAAEGDESQATASNLRPSGDGSPAWLLGTIEVEPARTDESTDQ